MICNASQNKQNKQIINPFPTIFIGLWEKMVVLIKHYVQNFLPTLFHSNGCLNMFLFFLLQVFPHGQLICRESSSSTFLTSFVLSNQYPCSRRFSLNRKQPIFKNSVMLCARKMICSSSTPKIFPFTSNIITSSNHFPKTLCFTQKRTSTMLQRMTLFQR